MRYHSFGLELDEDKTEALRDLKFIDGDTLHSWLIGHDNVESWLLELAASSDSEGTGHD